MKQGMEKELIVSLSILMLFLVVIIVGTHPADVSQNFWQAQSLLGGHLDITEQVLRTGVSFDTTAREGRYYWAISPLYSIVLLPLAAFFPWAEGPGIQMIPHLAICFSAFFLAYLLARRCGLGTTNALWLAFAFSFSSVLIGTLFYSKPNFTGHILAAVLMLAALCEYKAKNRPWLVGALSGLAMAARLPTALIIVFFGLAAWRHDVPVRKRAGHLAVLAVSFFLVAFGFGWFNAARFGNAFNNGYIGQTHSQLDLEHACPSEHVFSLANVPCNFQKYFLSLPTWRDGHLAVDPFGLSMVLMMPAFLWLAAERRPSREWLIALLVSLAIMGALLTFKWGGFASVGPRYAVDMLPLLYFMLVLTFSRRTFGFAPKAAIAASAALNLTLVVSNYFL